MSSQTMRAAWLAVADACVEADREASFQDGADRILTAMDRAVGVDSSLDWRWADTAAAIRAMCGPDEDEAPAADGFRDPRVDPRTDDVLLIDGIATQVLDADPDEGVEAHDITGAEWRMSLPDWQDYAARSVVLWQEDAPPPADVSLLALANRTLHAELEAARAEVARLNRVLAVERGDQTQAPAGWGQDGSGWRRSDGWSVHPITEIASNGMIQTWDTRDPDGWNIKGGRKSSALEAMEAIDAERGGVSDGKA